MTTISDARIELIKQEYIPELRFTEDLIPELEKKEFRDFFRMLSFAVLSKYISVKLTLDIKKMFSQQIFSKEFADRFPEIDLMIRLNKKGKELDFESGETVYLFEEFLILDRDFRNNENIKLFIDSLSYNPLQGITHYRDIFYHLKPNTYNDRKSESEHSEIERSLSVILGFIDLNEFLIALRSFFGNYNEDLPIALCWLYYDELFTTLKREAATMQQYYKWAQLLPPPEELDDVNENIIKKEIWKAQSEQYLQRSIITFNWLIGFEKSEILNIIKDVYMETKGRSTNVGSQWNYSQDKRLGDISDSLSNLLGIE